jgi:ubiquinone/menaquinone biosynthesis C-methylase UbiE
VHKERLTDEPFFAIMGHMANPPTGGAFLDAERVSSVLGLVPGMHAADLGCGAGYFVTALAKIVGAGGSVAAVDVRQEALDEVRAKAEALGLANVRLVRADLEVLGGTGIPDNSQDVALLANNLYQSQKKGSILKEAARMCKSGGRVVIIEWKKGGGGFGPPEELRTSEDDMKRLAEANGVRFQRPLDVGSYFYGLVFIKP